MATNNNWVATSGSWFSIASNWSLSHVPTGDETAMFSGNAYNCIVDQNVDCSGLIVSGTYAGAITATGYAFYINGNFMDDGTGNRNYGSGIIIRGFGTTLHLGSTLGTVTASSCAITLGDASTDTITMDDDKGGTFKSWTINGTVTSNGAAGSALTGTATLLTLGNNSTFTVNRAVSFIPTGSMTIFSVGTGVTWNGSANMPIYPNVGGGITITIPAYTYSGTGSFSYYTASNNMPVTYSLSGNINHGTSSLYFYAGNVTGSATVLNTNNYNITAGTYRHGSSTNTSSFTASYGSSVVSITLLDATHNSASATQTINLQTSQWTCTGNWAFGSNHTVNAGSSRVNINPTANVNITSSNKAFADLNFSGNSPLATGFFVDTPVISGNLGIYNGSSVNSSGLDISITSGCYITTSGRFSSSGIYTIGKDLTFGSGVTLNNSGMTLNLSGQTHTITTNGRDFPYTKIYNNGTWVGSGTLSRLTIGGNTTQTFEAGKTYRFNTYTAQDWWGGGLSSQILFRSSSDGFQTTFYAPINTITRYTDYKDINNLGVEIDASDGTSVDRGNNYGINFGGAIAHPRRHTDRQDDNLFIILKVYR
jgi:hypothetical protein